MDENYDVPYFALYADIDQLESLQNHETGLGVFSTCAVFVSRHIEDVLVRLRVEWPASVDACFSVILEPPALLGRVD